MERGKSSLNRWTTQRKPGWAGHPGLPRGRRLAGLLGSPLALALLLCAVSAQSASAQRTGVGAFAVEAVGGTIGSLVGFGVGAFTVDDQCDDELCFKELGVVLLTASAGATAGAVIAGRRADTNPSIVGSAIGSLAGAGAGLALLKVLEEIDPGLDDGAPAVIAFTVSQGIVTALGSRIAAALR
jgi:hypothetical protein